jgi:hypothetical protein
MTDKLDPSRVMHVYEMVAGFLLDHGFHGLVNVGKDCSCTLGRLAPCGIVRGDCVAAYRGPCDCGEHDCHWHIVPDETGFM